jgi:tetratricopeptide (TPR) repeat protein
VYSSLSKADLAISDFARSIALDPTYAEPYYNRAVIYAGMRQYDKAIPDYEKYISLITDPIFLSDAYLNRGIALYYTGNSQGAIADFSKVIELRPTFAKGYKARAMLYREMKKNDLADADEKKAAELSR